MGEPIIANGARMGAERGVNGGLNGNGRPVERSIYGKFFLTRTIHVHMSVVQILFTYMYVSIYNVHVRLG